MWQLAIVAPKHAVIALLVGVGVLAVVTRSDENACPFEQTWYKGDVHFNERIEFRADATGTWIASGMADDAPQERRTFRWSRTDDVVTVTHGEVTRWVAYSISRRRSWCNLSFKHHPLLSERVGSVQFSDRQ